MIVAAVVAVVAVMSSMATGASRHVYPTLIRGLRSVVECNIGRPDSDLSVFFHVFPSNNKTYFLADCGSAVSSLDFIAFCTYLVIEDKTQGWVTLLPAHLR